MQNETVAVESDSLLIDVDEVARLLSISRRTVLRADSAGKIPAPRRIGRCLRWSRLELSRWIDSGCPPRQKWLAILSNPKGSSLN